MSVQKFKRYEIQEELGIGGMAYVYRAYDPLFEREVALKVLKRELLDDPQLRDRFERETKIVAKLEHAAIVPVYDVGFDNNQLFYVMRHMTGGSLTERINNRSLTLDQIAYILLRIADALDYAHRKDIVHRDLKPGNILFDEVGNAFISDFGIAKLVKAATRITHSGIIGTPRYMSPEQARGDDTDGRSDIYSLAVLFYEILSGEAPFEATTPLGLALKHATEPAPDIRDVSPDLPEGLNDVLKKAMHKERDDRYQTCVEFANAFLEALPADTAPNANLITPLPPRSPQKYEALTEPPAPTPALASSMWFRIRMIGGVILMLLLGYLIWQAPTLAAVPDASTSTPEPATVTTNPVTPTESPPATATASPTETIGTALPTEIPGIGGAINIALTSNKDIFLMDMDGSNIRQLTNTNIPKFDLQWLPSENKLLYGEGNCVYTVNVDEDQPKPEEIVCFIADSFEGFRVSPDGLHVAISIDRRLIVIPFDLELFSKEISAFEILKSDQACIDYTDVAIKGAQWSADGGSLAILYQSAVNQRLGDTIRIMDVDLTRCSEVDLLLIDEFPGNRFVPDGYEALPVLPAHHWDGDQQFVFNTYIRNGGYGDLYFYDMSTRGGLRINPVDGTCCYRSGTFSPDGTHLLFIFQDINQGSESESQLFYIPIDQIGNPVSPIRLPLRFFPDIRENILVALRFPN